MSRESIVEGTPTSDDPRHFWPKMLSINLDLNPTQRLEAYILLNAMELCYPRPVDINFVRPGYTITLSGMLPVIDEVMLSVNVLRVRDKHPPFPIIAEARYRFNPSNVTIDTERAMHHLVCQLVLTGSTLLGAKMYQELVQGCDDLVRKQES